MKCCGKEMQYVGYTSGWFIYECQKCFKIKSAEDTCGPARLGPTLSNKR